MKKIIQTTLVVSFVFSLAHAQHNISTVAGNGTSGFSGDGSQATAAELKNPTAITFDASGNYYIADGLNNRIRMVNSSGVISTFAGNGTAGFSGDNGQATAAKLNYPTGVTVDGSGNVYIADHTNNRIRMVNGSGVITTIAGTGVAGYTGDGSQATAATFRSPSDVAVDANNNIYIADTFNDVIRKINTSGVISTIAGIGGQNGFSGDNGPAASAELNQPTGVTVDASTLLIADQNNNRVRLIASGFITTVAGNGTAGYGGDGGLATAAQIQGPNKVAVGPSGSLAIADTYNQVIRKVSITSGIIYTVGGNNTDGSGYSGDGGPATAAELNNPYSVAFDSHGDVYVADFSNNRVRKLTNIDVLGVDEINSNSGIDIYPNPANDNINIVMGTAKGNTTVALYNMLGQEVYNTIVKNSSIAKIPVSDLKQGIYLVKVLLDGGQVTTKKIEVTH